MINPIEVSLTASPSDSNPARDWFNEVELDAHITDAATGQNVRVPAFWAGGNEFRFRFAPPHAGKFNWVARCSLGKEASLEGQTGVINAVEHNPKGEILRHGRLHVASDGVTLEHADGTPFFWLADTWWMMFTKRLHWPSGYQTLMHDRIKKGYNVIQLVVGPLPDYDAPDQAFDPRQADETGWPWHPGWTRVNTDYFDRVDQTLWDMLEHGLLPCIVGMWAYWTLTMGEKKSRQHWRYLVARYASWPVAWCIGGEASMPTYHTVFAEDPVVSAKEANEQKQICSRLGDYIRELDAWHNPITIHPKAPGFSRMDLVNDSRIDIEMVQTTHMGYSGLHGHLEVLDKSLRTLPRVPVFSAEANYEGIMGASWHDIQRFHFWTAMTMGCCGHTYGAQGLWGMSSKEEPHIGYTGEWGRGHWIDAMKYLGSEHVGMGKKILTRFRWSECRPFVEPAAAALDRPWTFSTGIPNVLSLYYLPANTSDPRHLGCVAPGWMGKCLPIRIAPGKNFTATFIDVVTGEERPVGPVTPDAQGLWTPPRKPSCEDWLLVVEDATLSRAR